MAFPVIGRSHALAVAASPGLGISLIICNYTTIQDEYNHNFHLWFYFGVSYFPMGMLLPSVPFIDGDYIFRWRLNCRSLGLNGNLIAI